jgi:hypothetical protein
MCCAGDVLSTGTGQRTGVRFLKADFSGIESINAVFGKIQDIENSR